ncbi:methionyl-tRNA formyltransferase [Croceibacterium mercuriale]|uniref:Methionyl-tRNA formyltransferase n=1 Tax=Croceibacterium mercuriale TaxID=1572751 RepID=A0A0B2C2I2_9SPHN|nr:methionyl-tRNA formyltransferase [Croceibacterium mercuriale]KHL26201.1 methionyl-tRNA formyltransferase [Croceibacterium mercuriale]
MRITFMGTPDFALPTLDALVEAGHDVVAAYTQPPRPAGRGKAPRPSPVQLRAETLGIPVHSPKSLRNPEAQADFAALQPEVAVVVAYGLILPRPILDVPALGCINVHGSLLPRWRGAAPIQRAILAGDPVTGITIMRMAEGLDTGPMLATARVPVEDKTSGALFAELAEVGAHLLVEVLADHQHWRPEDQDELGANYAAKIDKAETRLDWTKPAELLEREVRAFAPVPGAWFELDGERIKVLGAHVVASNAAPGTVVDDQLTVACGEAALRPAIVQRAGRPAMPAADFLRGRSIPQGTVLR